MHIYIAIAKNIGFLNFILDHVGQNHNYKMSYVTLSYIFYFIYDMY